jgi:Transglycosylase-like domain
VSMRRNVVAATGATALLGLAPTAAFADTPSPKLERKYEKAYDKAARQDADPGRNILKDGVERPGTDRDASAGELRRSISVLRRMVAAPAVSTASVASPALEAIAACESGGDPTAISADGSYRGKYQFDYGTWASVGGSGDPAAAPESEQDMRAQMLYERSGSSPWPVCGG